MIVYIVVDAQNDFATGALGSKEAEDALPYISNVVNHALHTNGVLVYTHDTHFDDYLDTQEGRNLPVIHTIFGSWGWRIVDAVSVMPTEHNRVKHINKEDFGYNDWNYFFEDLCNEYKEDIEAIVICGFVTDICVIVNALSIKTVLPEVPMKVIAKACAGTTPEAHEAALRVMKSCQIEVMQEI